MKNLLFILFLASSLFLAIYCYRLYVVSQNELQLANQRILDRDSTIYQLQKKQGTTPAFNKPIAKQEAENTHILGNLSESDIKRLHTKGLKNPEIDLKQSLKTNEKNFLNMPGTMGGKMNIRDVKILNDRHALAYFEDGHNGGYVLLRYVVKPPNRISWTVLDSYYQ